MPFGGLIVNRVHPLAPDGDDEVDEAALAARAGRRRGAGAQGRARRCGELRVLAAPRRARRSRGCGAELGDDDPIVVPHLDGDVHDVDGLVAVHRHLFAEGAERSMLLERGGVLSDGPPLAVIAWPFEHGSPDIGMGAGAALLAGDAALHGALSGRRLGADRPADPGGRPVDRRGHADLRPAPRPGGGGRGRRWPAARSRWCWPAAASARRARWRAAAPHGAVWLDAHADFDTPDDNISGSMDVMALSILSGSAWPAQHATIPNAVAIAEQRVALLGVRDLADYQRDRLAALRAAHGARRLRRLGGDHGDQRAPAASLPARRPRRARHLRRPRQPLAAPGGPSLETVLAAIDATFDHATVLAAALTAYEPAVDEDGRILAAARTIARRIAERARAQR